MVSECLDPYFNIWHEHLGVNAITGKRKRIDAILTPKQILQDNGFPNIPIGLQMKADLLKNGDKRKAVDLLTRAFEYRITRFEMNSGHHFLPLILIFPPFKRYLQDSEEFNNGFKYSAKRIAGKFFIGELKFYEQPYDFIINLCGHWYYRMHRDGTGERWDNNWGFEKYEEQKQLLGSDRITDEDRINLLSLIGL